MAVSAAQPTGELFRSGAPIWSFVGYRTAFAVASGAAIAGWCVAALAWWRRAWSRLPRAGRGVDIAALLAFALVVGWIVAVVGGSEPPVDGQFCFTPSTWAGTPAATCVAAWPVRLMAATLAWPLTALAAALAIRGAACRDGRRIVLFGALAAAALVAALVLGPTGLVTPDMFSDGGITASRAAAAELTGSVEGGVAAVIALAVFIVAARVPGRPPATGQL